MKSQILKKKDANYDQFHQCFQITSSTETMGHYFGKRNCSFSRTQKLSITFKYIGIIYLPLYYSPTGVYCSTVQRKSFKIVMRIRLYWRRVEALRQYGIGFNVVPWGDIIEKGAINIIIVKKNSVICSKKKQPLWINKLYKMI